MIESHRRLARIRLRSNMNREYHRWYSPSLVGGGYYDYNLYFNNPVDFIAGEHEQSRLDLLRKQDIILVVGRDDHLRESNERRSRVMWSKGVGDSLRLWDGWSQDWPYWQKMILLYIGGHD